MNKKYKLLVILEDYHTDWLIASGISHFKSLHRRNIRLIVNHHEKADHIIKIWNPDVLILNGSCAEKVSIPRPSVFVYGERGGSFDFSITLDNEAIGRSAAKYFLDNGFRNFAFSTGQHTMAFSSLRLKGFQDVLSPHGFTPLIFDTHCFSGLNPIQTTDQNIALFAQGLKNAPKPLAVLSYDDTHALHVLEACEQVGLKVPEEVSILGVDNHPILCIYPTPQLSSIELPHLNIGKTAARMAEELLFNKNKSPEHIMVTPLRVVTRESSDIIATKSPELKLAIQYITEHIGEPLQPKDVIEQIFVSRSKLQRIFREELRRTILEEIQRQKLARAKELLEQTPLAVYEIGDRCGMPSSPQFIRFFTQKEGISPLKHREKHYKKSADF